MPDTVYYCIDGVNNKVETLSKEQILDAIEQAIEGGSVLAYDDAFVTQIKEINKDRALKVWIGTQAEYNAISEKQDYVLYIISDDQQKEDIIEYIEQLHEDSDSKIEAEAEARADADAALQQNISDEASARASADSLLNSAVGNVSKRTELYFICETPTATADKICVLQDNGTIPTITLGTRIVVLFKNPLFISDTSTAFPTLTLQDANGNRLYNSALYIDGGVGAGRINCKQKVWAQDGVVRFVLGKVSGVSANRWIMQADYKAQTDAKTAADAVSSEATARSEADTTLQGNIDAEAGIRQGADATLQGNIENVAKRTELYFTCDTASATAAKVCVLQDSGTIQTIAEGTRIVVNFKNKSQISDSSEAYLTLTLQDRNGNQLYAATNVDAGNNAGRVWGKSEVWSANSMVAFVLGKVSGATRWIMECDFNAQTKANAAQTTANAAQADVTNVAKRTELYFACDTASSAAAKVAILQDSGAIQPITTGTRIVVKFANESKISDSSTTFITLQLKDSNNNEIFAAKNIDAGNGKGRIWGKSEVWSKDSVVSFVYGSANNIDAWIIECDYNAQTAAKAASDEAAAVADSITSRFGAANTTTTVTQITETELWHYTTGHSISLVGDEGTLSESFTNFTFLEFYVRQKDDTQSRLVHHAILRFRVSEIIANDNHIELFWRARRTPTEAHSYYSFEIGYTLSGTDITCDYAFKDGSSSVAEPYLVDKIIGVKHTNVKIPVKTVT